MSDEKEQIHHFAVILEKKPNERRKKENSALHNHPRGQPNERRKRANSALHNHDGGEAK